MAQGDGYKEEDYEGMAHYICSKCGYDTFKKDIITAHVKGDVHDGPSSQVPPK